MASGDFVNDAAERALPWQILDRANEIIHGKRNDEYGPAEKSFETIARFWTIYMKQSMSDRDYFTGSDIAMMMILLKVARTNDVPTDDSLIDICGYAALAAGCID